LLSKHKKPHVKNIRKQLKA